MERIPSVEDSLTDPNRPETGRTSRLKKIHLWVAGGIALLAVVGIVLTTPEKERDAEAKRAAAEKQERLDAANIDLPGHETTFEGIVKGQDGGAVTGTPNTVDTPGALVPPSLTGTTKAPAPPVAQALPPVPQADGKPYYPGVSPPLPKEDDPKQKELDKQALRDEQIRTAGIMAFDTGARPKDLNNPASLMQARMAELDALKNTPAKQEANAKYAQLQALKENLLANPPADSSDMPPGMMGGQPMAQGVAPGEQSNSNVKWQEAQQAKMAKAGNPLLMPERQMVPYVVGQGTVIPGTLVTEINSDMPGQLTAIVSMDVYDSGRGEKLLIPKGSRLIGVYNNDVRPGQERVMAAFQRMIFPNGTSVNLQGMPLSDAQGRGGAQDDVDNHFFKMFFASFMTAGLAALFENNNTPTVTYGNNSNMQSNVTSATGQILVDIARSINERNTRIPPTITIRQGHKFNIIVNKDIALQPYQS